MPDIEVKSSESIEPNASTACAKLILPQAYQTCCRERNGLLAGDETRMLSHQRSRLRRLTTFIHLPRYIFGTGLSIL